MLTLNWLEFLLCCAQIWRLPSSLTSVRRGEEALLRKLAVADDVPEALRGSHTR